MLTEPTKEPTKATADSSAPPDIVRSTELFRGRKEIIVEHEGAIYRLRITRRGKLILHK